MSEYQHLLPLIHNLALLFALAFIFDLATSRWTVNQSALRRLMPGIFIGFLGMATMLTPWVFAPGILFDARSILLGVSGLFFGWIPTAIAVLMTVAFRLYQGGAGALTGICVIVASALIGLAWRRWTSRPRFEMSWKDFYVFGLTIHLVVLALMVTLPKATVMDVLTKMSLPYLLLYPIGTMLLGMLMVARMKRRRMEKKLLESERFAVSTMDALTTRVAVLDETGIILAVNQAWRDAAQTDSPVIECICGKSNYLSLCDESRGDNAQQAILFAQGIREVMAGRQKEFVAEYARLLPDEQQWFLGRVTRFADPGPLRIVVSFEDVTWRKRIEEDLKRHRERLEELVDQRTSELDQRNRELVMEIDQRRMAEQTIRESEDRFRGLVEMAPVIIYRIRDDRIIEFISPAVRQLGYEPEDLIGHSFEQIVHPDDREKVRNILVEKRIGSRRTRNVEVRLLHRREDDHIETVSCSFVELSARGYWSVPDADIQSPEKRFLYTLGIAHDITGRKEAEDALRDSERKLQLLKDVASAANAAATLDDVFRVAVEGVAQYLNWPLGHVYLPDPKHAETLIPSNIWYTDGSEDYSLFRAETDKTIFTPGAGMIGRILENKKTLWIDDVTTNPDFLRNSTGTNPPVRGGFGFPVMVRGKVTAVLEFFTSISQPPRPEIVELMDEIGAQLGAVIERKQVEEELQKLYRAVEHSPATVMITNIDGVIQYVNPKFNELTGFTPQEAIGANPRILKSGTHDDRFYQDLWDTILGGREWYGTFCNRKENGELYWERASISPVRNDLGEITNFVAVKEDITQLLQYEKELKQAKENAERANQSKSDFLANMSHELRTPLNAVIGFSEVLKEQYFGPLTEKQEEYVKDILESGKHLLSLINDILDLSKVEAGMMTLDLSHVNVSDLIANSLLMIRGKASKHRITLHEDIAPDAVEIDILADERKLKQVLYNLLSNAAKFTPDGGTIRVTARRTHGDGAGLEISVKDSGIGVSPEDREKIFEPFFQVERLHQGKTPGTGLGLSLSRELVELHGGRLWLSGSDPHTGSTFSFRIPLSPAEPPEPDSGSHGKGRTS